jgi:hypothetical protein
MKDSVVLTDRDGVPLGGEHRRKLLPGENELVIARQLLAKAQRGSDSATSQETGHLIEKLIDKMFIARNPPRAVPTRVEQPKRSRSDQPTVATQRSRRIARSPAAAQLHLTRGQ